MVIKIYHESLNFSTYIIIAILYVRVCACVRVCVCDIYIYIYICNHLYEEFYCVKSKYLYTSMKMVKPRSTCIATVAFYDHIVT